MNKIKLQLLLIALLIFAFTHNSMAQMTDFTYQGRLSDGGASAANGTYQMQFALYDALANGNQIGATLTNQSVNVVNGAFTVTLNFSAPDAFDGNARYLEISVKKTSEQNYTTLTPRQPITSAPYAIRAREATTAETSTNALNVDGTPAAEIIKEGDTRLTDERTPLAGSANYVQNRTTEQASTDFNINGSGAANILNARTQFNLGGNRILSADLSNNLFAGFGAGTANTVGGSNSFFGAYAGLSNTRGNANSFFGASAGRGNTTGSRNAFFGLNAGTDNTIGTDNSFFGASAGEINTSGFGNTFFGSYSGADNTTGANNAFFGMEAGFRNTTGTSNLFVGVSAGYTNETGDGNSFIGRSAGFYNTSGNLNTFIGINSGLSNRVGSNNTVIGNSANVGALDLNFATAIGSGAVVDESNTVVLGRALDTVRIPGNLTVTGTVNATVTNALNATNAVNATTATNAVNAENATNAVNAENATNAVNATTATNAVNATTATNAVNSEQLGGVAAANYLTNTSNLGQSVITALGGERLTVNDKIVDYTNIPGLTQTVDLPANSDLLIMTDGGIQSTGAVGSYSVADVAVFVDGAMIVERRIFIVNNPVGTMVNSWTLSLGRTLAAGNHLIEVKIKNGFLGSNAPSVVGGDPLVNSQLTILVIKK